MLILVFPRPALTRQSFSCGPFGSLSLVVDGVGGVFWAAVALPAGCFRWALLGLGTGFVRPLSATQSQSVVHSEGLWTV